MKNFFTFLILGIFTLALPGCYMDAHIGEIISSVISADADDSTVAVAPSVQHKSIDTSNTYRARSAVGEVTSGTSADASNEYSAEISITYQRL